MVCSESVTVAEVIEAVEGPLLYGYSREDAPPQLEDVWLGLDNVMRQFLNTISLPDLLARRSG